MPSFSTILPNNYDTSGGDYCCANCNEPMCDNGTYPPTCSTECAKGYKETQEEGEKQ